jgi:hypothetical protein
VVESLRALGTNSLLELCMILKTILLENGLGWPALASTKKKNGSTNVEQL